jgi:Ca2+-binding EF-hand superfamily protein
MPENSNIWESLGRYIARSLENKRGVSVPSLGVFTFQDSFPVFIVSSDLSSAKPAIMIDSVLQPLSRIGTSKAPTSRLNYSELASISGQTKENLQRDLSTAIRELGDRLKRNENLKLELPPVGFLVARDGFLAAQFSSSISEIRLPTSRGAALTADGARWLKNNLGIDMNRISTPNSLTSSRISTSHSYRPKTTEPFARMQKSARPPHSSSFTSLHSSTSQFDKAGQIVENIAKLTLVCQAKDDTQHGLLDYESFKACLVEAEGIYISEEELNEMIDSTGARSGNYIRYKLFFDKLRRNKNSKSSRSSQAASDYTANYDRSSIGPLARAVWDKRLILAQLGSSNGMSARIKVTASELFNIVKKAGVNCNIHQFKALLRVVTEGESVSVLDLIQYLRPLVAPSADISVYSEAMSSRSTVPPTPVKPDDNLNKVRDFLKMYRLEEIFQNATGGRESITSEEFVKYIVEIASGRVKAYEVQKAFIRAAQGSLELTKDEFCSVFALQENPKHFIDRGLRKLRNWLRTSRLTTEQGFEYLLEMTRARSNKLTLEDFTKAMREFDFNSQEAELLFKEIDVKHDQAMDITEWMNKVYEVGGPIQSVRDVFLQNNLNTEDLLIKMNIGDKQKLTVEDLSKTLLKLDPTLTTGKAIELARGTIGNKSTVEVQDLFVQLSQGVFEYAGDWKEQILKRIQANISENPDRLRREFEKADTKHVGKLALADFQDCLFRMKLGLQDIEIERLARILDRQDTHFIDYNDFLDKLQGPSIPLDPLRNCIQRLLVFIRQNNLTPAKLIRKLGSPVSVSDFADFLSLKVNKKAERNILLDIATKMDLNRDGYIDLEDLSATLSCKSFMTVSNSQPYPARKISPDRAKAVIKDIRAALVAKRMNFQDAFRTFDVKKKGMLSCKEFSDGLSKVIELSQPVKDGLFAVMDKQGIGMVDFTSFLSVLKDTDIQPKAHGDDWSWENKALSAIRDWISSENLTIEDAFRAFDKDFDGIMSKDDLKRSLIEILKYEEREMPSSRIDRLYKLMDIYKRNSIQLADFKSLFEESNRPDWKNSARQQLGLMLSRIFPDIHRAFETISELTLRITFEHFSKWVEKNQALKGFNLTHQLLQQLFADLDPHKKGYLSEQDFVLAFNNFNWKSQCLKELIDSLRSNFSDIKVAFDLFLSHKKSPGNSINPLEFEAALHAIVPNRYTKEDIQQLWFSISSNQETIDFNAFKRKLDYTSSLSSFSHSRMTERSNNSRSKSQGKYTTSSSISRLSDDNPIKRFHTLLKASPYSMEDIFKMMDMNSDGQISTIEFRNALRKLNLGLTARDIDLLMQRVDTDQNGQINWKEFSSRFKVKPIEKQISGIANQRIDKLKEMMFSYMLSPVDAFHHYDPDRSGSLKFAEFSRLVSRLYEHAGEPCPAFTVIKDLFDIIDIRKDGQIDMREWQNTFKDTKTQGWEGSKEFDSISHMFARHRKVLLLTFEAMNKEGRVSYQQARNVLGSVLKQANLSEDQWQRLIRIAEKDGVIDYRLLLDIYKDRSTVRQMHPRPL